MQGAVRLARNDFLFAKLRSGVFEDARNEQGAVHHEARCGHGESLQFLSVLNVLLPILAAAFTSYGSVRLLHHVCSLFCHGDHNLAPWGKPSIHNTRQRETNMPTSGLMMNRPLLISGILEHGAAQFGDQEIVCLLYTSDAADE